MKGSETLSLLKFFGTSSAVPSANRGFACIGLVEPAKNDIVLLDCGDGSIRKLIENQINLLSISNILITHCHSDHLSGLTQIIESMGIRGRASDIDVYGPQGLQEYFEMVRKITNVAANAKFRINIKEVQPGQEIKVAGYVVESFVMQHTIPALGFKIKGRDFCISYTGDTEPCLGSGDLAKESDILIHEATFLARDLDRARRSKHSTPSEAATTAKENNARKLILTHVDETRETEREMLEEAMNIHSDTSVARDGSEFQLP